MKKFIALALTIVACSSMVGVPIFTQAAVSTQENEILIATNAQNPTNANEVVNLVNKERSKAGLAKLTVDAKLTKAAQVRAKEITKSFSHTRPNNTTFSTAIKEQGATFRGSGENIAWGQKTPAEVMKGWMNSAGHRANILGKNYKNIGVANYKDASGRNYWVELFTY